MKILFCLISFIISNCFGAQPYFPSQIVFSLSNDQTIYAIDEVNQRAFMTLRYGTDDHETTYVLKHFPYAIPDSPQSKYYVQLLIDSAPFGCMYGTYWKYGGSTFNSFPSHWLNGSSYEIKNYMNFRYDMLYSNSSSQDEDYWYANITCQVDGGQSYPCEEIFFKKNTEIPLRSTRVVRRGWTVIQETINYKIIQMGKSDEKYFNAIPKNWTSMCRDVMLGLLYYPQTVKIDLKQSSKVEIWLITPPHRINGNDTVRIQWKSKECNDCFVVSPEELYFNGENFQKRQTLTITRVKDGPKAQLIPDFYGGGFDLVVPVIYPIYIE